MEPFIYSEEYWVFICYSSSRTGGELKKYLESKNHLGILPAAREEIIYRVLEIPGLFMDRY
jgi:hypothetical protein